MNPPERASALFTAAFGHAPAAVGEAPGRVNLIGEHVDYHGGHVLPVATRWRTAVALGPGTGLLRAVSEHGRRLETPWPPRPTRQWSDYVAGVAAVPNLGAGFGGLDAAIASDVPIGAGVSSSAALEVATARALAALTGQRPAERDLADIAWRAETEFVGVPCGRMDQLAAALGRTGRALLINCRTFAAREVPLGVDLVLVDSGEPHTLRESAYAERRREGEEALRLLRAATPSVESLVDIPPAMLARVIGPLPETLKKRARHVVNENQRAVLAASALEAGDDAALGLLINASHASLRDLYECSTPKLDAIVQAAAALPRVLGARLVGAGWGGSVLVVAERGAGGAVQGLLEKASGRDPKIAARSVSLPV